MLTTTTTTNFHSAADIHYYVLYYSCFFLLHMHICFSPSSLQLIQLRFYDGFIHKWILWMGSPPAQRSAIDNWLCARSQTRARAQIKKQQKWIDENRLGVNDSSSSFFFLSLCIFCFEWSPARCVVFAIFSVAGEIARRSMMARPRSYHRTLHFWPPQMRMQCACKALRVARVCVAVQ